MKVEGRGHWCCYRWAIPIKRNKNNGTFHCNGSDRVSSVENDVAGHNVT